MHTLLQFRLILSDAWGNPFPGMQVTLGHSAQGKQLNTLIGGERYTLLLQGHEDDFCHELLECGVRDWDGLSYEPRGGMIIDGDQWCFVLQIDDMEVCCEGANGYPPGFVQFLKLLHRHGIPRCKMESGSLAVKGQDSKSSPLSFRSELLRIMCGAKAEHVFDEIDRIPGNRFCCHTCLGYTVIHCPQAPSQCPECHQNTLFWMQYPGGAFGCKCTACGIEGAADLNTKCELDRGCYSIVISRTKLDNPTALQLSKLIHHTALETKHLLAEDDYLIEGSLSEIWALKPKLAALPVEISIHPADMEERYFYAKKCRYLHKRIH